MTLSDNVDIVNKIPNMMITNLGIHSVTVKCILHWNVLKWHLTVYIYMCVCVCVCVCLCVHLNMSCIQVEKAETIILMLTFEIESCIIHIES